MRKSPEEYLPGSLFSLLNESARYGDDSKLQLKHYGATTMI
jgi:hypothetical protein